MVRITLFADSVLILAVDLSGFSDFPTLSCELTTQALPPACSAVGLPRMEGVATRAIRDATSCQQTRFLDCAIAQMAASV